MRDACCIIRASDWEALTPLQKSVMTQRLVRQAHAARTRAIGRMLAFWRTRSPATARAGELAAMNDASPMDGGTDSR